MLATAGDRLGLLRLVWTTGEAGADSEIEILHVHEVDDDGRFAQIVIFDPNDRAAADTELFERGVALGEITLPLARYLRAWNDHDLECVRPMLPEYFDDHRRTGVGRLPADDYVESLRALFELSDDVRLGPLYQVARTPHGFLSVNHWLGTNAEGGEIEAAFASLVRIESDRIVAVDLYEVERAKARFAVPTRR